MTEQAKLNLKTPSVEDIDKVFTLLRNYIRNAPCKGDYPLGIKISTDGSWFEVPYFSGSVQCFPKFEKALEAIYSWLPKTGERNGN